MSNLRLAFVIEAIDRATKPVRAVVRTIDRLAEPARRVQAAFGGVKAVAMAVVGAVVGISAAAGAAIYSLKRLVDVVDQIGDASAELGITTQDFQQMGFAAEMSGSSAQEMAQALLFLNRSMGEARGGNKETLAWFQRIGITLEDLKSPSFTAVEAIERIADTFERVGDSGGNAGKKIEVSTALMGRSGFRMIQMLNGGSRGIRALRAEADRLGVVLDSETVKAMAEFNDSWARLRMVAFGAIANALKPVMPIIQDLVGRLMDWIVANRELIALKVEAFIRRVAEVLPAFLDGLKKVIEVVSRFVEVAGRVAEALGGWPNVLSLLVGLMGVRLAASVLSLASALGVLSAAAWANPMTYILLAVMALIAAVPLLILHFDSVAAKMRQLRDAMPKWLVDMLEGSSTGQLIKQITGGDKSEYQDGRLDRQGAAITPTLTPQEAQEQALRDAGFGGQKKSSVSGTIGIKVDVEGRLKGVSTDVRGPLDFDAYTGVSMAGV